MGDSSPDTFEAHSVGGQAVIEGVMMRSPRWWAVSVRRPSGALHIESHPVGEIVERRPWLDRPLLRGVIALGEAMSIGVRALAISARHSSGEESEEMTPQEIRGAISFAFLFFLVLFIVAPALLIRGGSGEMRFFVFESQQVVRNLVEGLVRVGIFLGYVLLVSLLPDVRRVFQYHGAEHMVIAATEETGRSLTVDDARPFSTIHVRCGTNFLFLVVLLAVAVFSVIGRDPWWWRISSRILLLPVVAGISYETLRVAARHRQNPLVRAITAPGLLLQRVTTREPSDDQLEVAIAAMDELRARERFDGDPEDDARGDEPPCGSA